MKTEEQIYQDYLEFYIWSKFWYKIFGGYDENWKRYLNGYEMGYQEAIEENNNSWWKELGIDPKKYPTGTDDLFDAMRTAVKEYYRSLDK